MQIVLFSDDDEFYDRTKKTGVNKSVETQAIETAESLLDKKEALMKEIDEKRRLLAEEKNKMSESVAKQDAGDALDAFMSGLSSQLGKLADLDILFVPSFHLLFERQMPSSPITMYTNDKKP